METSTKKILKIIDAIYNYEKKWEPNILKLYKDKKDFQNSYLKVIKDNPRCIYEYIIILYIGIIQNENLKKLSTIEKLSDTTELLLQIGKLLKPYKLLKKGPIQN